MRREMLLSVRVLLSAVALTCSACTAASEPPSTTRPTSTSTSLPAVTTSTTTAPTTTTTRVVEESPLFGKVVVVDPGHNGLNWAHPDEIGRLVDIGNGQKACNTTGTSTSDGYTEAEFNWTIAMLVVPLLEAQGADVILTRQDNDGWGPCINERATVGNRSGADVMISIHADGGPGDGRGFHVIHPANTPGLTDDIYDESLRLAQEIHRAYLATSMPIADYLGDGGYSERDDLGGLNLSDVPAVFIETGNMRNEEDAGLLTDPGFQDRIARAIVEGLASFLNAQS